MLLDEQFENFLLREAALLEQGGVNEGLDAALAVDVANRLLDIDMKSIDHNKHVEHSRVSKAFSDLFEAIDLAQDLKFNRDNNTKLMSNMNISNRLTS